MVIGRPSIGPSLAMADRHPTKPAGNGRSAVKALNVLKRLWPSTPAITPEGQLQRNKHGHLVITVTGLYLTGAGDIARLEAAACTVPRDGNARKECVRILLALSMLRRFCTAGSSSCSGSAYPRVAAKLLLLDRILNLVEGGVDVALSIGWRIALRLQSNLICDRHRGVELALLFPLLSAMSVDFALSPGSQS
jgi:hypothetical protein